MRVLFGIGNPGSRYLSNRHNVGLMFLDFFAVTHSLTFTPSKNDYYVAEGKILNESFSLIKPTTYVNQSGIAALQVVQNYNIPVTDFLLLHDDLNLEFPALRVKVSGGDGGHNGVYSVIYHLSSEEFSRLRFGIGNEFEKGEMAEYVLTDFNNDEMKQLEESFKTAAYLAEEFIKGGIKNLLDANSSLTKAKKDRDKPDLQQ